MLVTIPVKCHFLRFYVLASFYSAAIKKKKILHLKQKTPPVKTSLSVLFYSRISGYTRALKPSCKALQMKNDAILFWGFEEREEILAWRMWNRGSGRCNEGVGAWGFGDKFNLGNKREFETGAASPLIKSFFQISILNCFHFEFSGMHCLKYFSQYIECDFLFLRSDIIKISVSWSFSFSKKKKTICG